MKVYSPSQTTLWMKCPVERRLSSIEGWEPRELGKRELAGALGTAIAAGLGAYFITRMESPGGVFVAQHFASIASANIRERQAMWRSKGYTLPTWHQAQHDSLEARAFKAVLRFVTDDCNTSVLPVAWVLRAVEHTFPDHGFCRPDLIVETHPGEIAVIDWKCKLNLEAKWRRKEIDRYESSWQLFHNSWAASSLVDDRLPAFYYIGLIVLEPRWSVELIPFPIIPEAFAAWRDSANRVWRHMESEDLGKEHPWMAAKHTDEFGDCAFKLACPITPVSAMWNEDLMEREYVRKKVKLDGPEPSS